MVSTQFKGEKCVDGVVYLMILHNERVMLGELSVYCLFILG